MPRSRNGRVRPARMIRGRSHLGLTPEVLVVAVADSSAIADLVRHKLSAARDQLIDRNLRNKLVNCQLTSKRAKQIRVVDEIADQVFASLVGQKRELTFAAGRAASAADRDEEADPDFTDTWVPTDDGEVDGDGVSKRHRDNVLQTQLTSEGLQKRLTSLYYEGREAEEEQGVNVLYLALGFLKWFEDANSEVERFAPLILVPVELGRQGAKDRFRLKVREEDLFTNVSLKLWLSEFHAIQFPELPEEDAWQPSSYFSAVRAAVAKEKRWEVLENEMLLGFFSFSKFLLWRDLDPANWPVPGALLGHGVLQKLLAPGEDEGQPDAPIIPDDKRVDDAFKAADQVCVLDADSSQVLAIQTALAGRNLVIQGPPGTGKSQTISNLIASAMHAGKTVLFVAEKLAALEVVHDRLKAVELGPLCLELHGRKVAKTQVVAQLNEALNAVSPPAPSSSLCRELDRVTEDLWAHSDRYHHVYHPSELTPYQALGGICALRDSGAALPDFKVVDAEKWSSEQIDTFLKEVEALSERLTLSGVPARHPWRGSSTGAINPLDGERLAQLATAFAAALQKLLGSLAVGWKQVKASESAELKLVPFSMTLEVAKALRVAADRPDETIELLCRPRWAEEIGGLRKLADLAQRVHEERSALSGMVVEAAWQRDWSAERTEIAGSGRSLFRFLRGPYRAAIRTLSGHLRGSLPKSYEDRVALLDRLMACQQLVQEFDRFAATYLDDLGAIGQSLPAGWSRVTALAHWVEATKGLNEAVAVRSPRCLRPKDECRHLSERVVQEAHAAFEALNALRSFIGLREKAWSGELAEIALPIAALVERAAAWRDSPQRYNEWPPVRQGLELLHARTTGGFLEKVYRGDIQPADMRSRVHLAILEQIWNEMCRQEPGLSMADGRVLDAKVADFRRLDARRVEAAAREVARKHFDAKPTGQVGEMGIIRGEANKKRNLLPVRKLLEKAGGAVQKLKPVFLMSPLSVAQYLAPGRLQFDLLLIDEASQVRPADALGAVARAKQVVVVGDAKQLPPTDFFNRMVADGDGAADDEAAAPGPPLGDMESILSLCDATFTSRTMLAWHYRSQHPALIAVSNRNFYENRLLLPPSVVTSHAVEGLGVFFHRTPDGGYDRGRSATNLVEAEIVADAVCEVARRHPEKSLGVGTFSVSQRDAIRDLVDARRRADPSLEPFFATSREHPFFVKNLESIQGDERDIIFISVGYGRDKDGRLVQNFGPIGRDGGERRLNVLISRARERCEVFSPITADDVDASNRKPGLVALKEFLQFAQKGYFDVPTKTNKAFDSDFEESVANYLKRQGYEVHAQVGMAGFYIDLGVIDRRNPNRYLVGIECDGATYHSSRSARDRDRIRQAILESRGWKIHRIWSTDWFHRRADQEKRLLDMLTKYEFAPSDPSPGTGAGGFPEPLDGEAEQAVGSGGGAAVPVAPPAPELSVPYVEARFSIRQSVMPHEADSRVVQDHLRSIVVVEGPIHRDEVAKRLTTLWGLERTGSRIDETVRKGLLALVRGGALQRQGDFYSIPGNVLERARDRSQTRSTGLRKAEYLPPSEIVLGARHLIEANVRVDFADLVVEVSRLFGFQRTGADLQAVIEKALAGAIVAGQLVQDESGGVSLVESAAAAPST